GKARLRRDRPCADAVRCKRAELVDELPIVIEPRREWRTGRMVEQPRADAVPNLTPAALLIGRIEGINSEIVHVDRAAFVDQPQRTSPVGAPARLASIGPVVAGSRVQL